MTCPYCKSEMLRGKILGDRKRLHWVDYNSSGFLGLILTKYLHLGQWSFWDRPFCEAYYCSRCRRIIINPSEIEGSLE